MAGTSLGTAYVQIVPSADGIKGSIQSALDPEAKAAGTSTGTKIASFVKKALIGGAIGKVLKDTIQEGSAFEQLKGGVQKIFDEANQSQIFEDAKNAYKELNMSANEYLESINAVGATFASTMGDQKGYDVARKGMQAISDYASGTGRDINELNEKYKLITRSTSSYQSIADQFSGILPATSKDFLAAAQSAGLLDASYTKLTDVPLPEYQAAVTAMLGEGVDALGLTGNTAKEAADTLSGSFLAMKGAVSNFMAQLVMGEDLTGTLDGVFDSVLAFGKNLVKAFGNILLNLPDALGHLGDLIIEKITAMGDDSSIPEAAGTFIKSFAVGLITNLPKLLAAIAGLAGVMVSTLVKTLGGLLKPAITAIATKFGAIKGALTSKASAAVSAVKAKFAAVKSAIIQPFETAKNKVKAVIDKIKGFFRFKVSAPHVPLPHFSISPAGWKIGDLLKGTRPSLSVRWYKKAEEDPYMFGNATLFGAGERNDELLYGRAALMRDIKEATSGGGEITINLYYNASDDANDMIRDLARGVQRYRMAGAI